LSLSLYHKSAKKPRRLAVFCYFLSAKQNPNVENTLGFCLQSEACCKVSSMLF
jgi:hypothetical protein